MNQIDSTRIEVDIGKDINCFDGSYRIISHLIILILKTESVIFSK